LRAQRRDDSSRAPIGHLGEKASRSRARPGCGLTGAQAVLKGCWFLSWV
jgi:hypothetical protein